jgi:phosphorylcholine metabolism protein LicD
MKLYFDKNNNVGINNVIIRIPQKKNKHNIPLHISDRHIYQMEYNLDTIKKRVPSLFIDQTQKNYYFASTGITNLTLTTYNEFIHDQAILFFNILSRCRETFEYAIFAGNSVGLLRNQNNLPWGDDYDIIIFDKHVPILLKMIVPELENIGFKIESKIEHGVTCGIQIFGPTINLNNHSSPTLTSVFHCDVFFSYFDKNNFLKNRGGWGLYHEKNIPHNIVVPFKRHMFHGMLLPFFNNPKKEVEICYTNIDKCSIFSHHLQKSQNNLSGTIFYNKWENAYLDFKYIVKKSIENTKNAIGAATAHSNDPLCKIKLVLNADNKNNLLGRSSCISSKLNFFCYLSEHNIGSIVAHADASEFICEHAADVKFYFPEIDITYIDDGCKPSPVVPIFYIYIDIFIQGEEKK